MFCHSGTHVHYLAQDIPCTYKIHQVHKERKDKHFIKKPIYPGGKDALRKFIRENMQYPQEALQARIEGTVTVKYTIDYKGVVTEAHVVSSLGHGCDEEAIRLTKLLKFEVPKSGRRVRVQFHKDIHIHFRLPAQKPTKRSITYQYVTPASKAQHPKPSDSRPSSYTYTIKIKK